MNSKNLKNWIPAALQQISVRRFLLKVTFFFVFSRTQERNPTFPATVNNLPIPKMEVCRRYWREIMHCWLFDRITMPNKKAPIEVDTPMKVWRRMASSPRPSSMASGTCSAQSVKYVGVIHILLKVIYTKYSKHWPYTVAHTINCVCHSIRSMFRVLGIYNFESCPTYFLIWNKIIVKSWRISAVILN